MPGPAGPSDLVILRTRGPTAGSWQGLDQMCSFQTNWQGGVGAAPLSAVNQGGDPAGLVPAWGSAWRVQGLGIASGQGFCQW